MIALFFYPFIIAVLVSSIVDLVRSIAVLVSSIVDLVRSIADLVFGIADLIYNIVVFGRGGRKSGTV